MKKILIAIAIISAIGTTSCSDKEQVNASDSISLDLKILNYLIEKRNTGFWTDFNIPFADGEELEKLVLQNNSKTILEIGTSTGHSTIWLAKAAAKTGGKVITIEIDKGRFDRAKRNFEDAGVSHLIEMKLGDANLVIPTLNERFDFVFSDATWSTQPDEGYLAFFRLCDPKLIIGGIYTMHNVTDGFGDDGRFFRYLQTLGTYQTSILRVSNNGISVSKKLR